MEIKIFTHKRLKESFDPLLLCEIKKNFKEYKETGIRPKTFGRDTTYDRPQSVKDSNLWHIHLKDKTSKNWDKPWIRIYDMTSDTALIYTKGYHNPNYYLIISIIDNAHSYYGGSERYLREMAEIARKFQQHY